VVNLPVFEASNFAAAPNKIVARGIKFLTRLRPSSGMLQDLNDQIGMETIAQPGLLRICDRELIKLLHFPKRYSRMKVPLTFFLHGFLYTGGSFHAAANAAVACVNPVLHQRLANEMATVQQSAPKREDQVAREIEPRRGEAENLDHFPRQCNARAKGQGIGSVAHQFLDRVINGSIWIAVHAHHFPVALIEDIPVTRDEGNASAHERVHRTASAVRVRNIVSVRKNNK